MINPQWSVVDLDPVTWRAIGELINPGLYIRAGEDGEHALYVLHDNGRLLNVVDTETGRRHDLGIGDLSDPDRVASVLYGTGAWDRVHIVDRQHLAAVAHEAMSDPRTDLTLDAYYRLVSYLMWANSDSRYVVYPPRDTSWHGWTYGGVQSWVQSLPDPCSIALGVIGEAGLRIGVIADIEDARICVLTTFESLPIPRDEVTLDQATADRLWDAIGAKFSPPAEVLLCSVSVFKEWIKGASDKQGTIAAAVADGTAFRHSR